MSSSHGSGALNGDLKQRDKTSALEHMMQECTNMIAKEKFHTQQPFQHKGAHPSGTKALPSARHGFQFAPSGFNAASNVNQVQPPSKVQGFPTWCCIEQVPVLYRHIENYTTSNGAHEIANGLLLPVLLSSGLQREILGLIWQMTNKTTPGVLTREELYASLALVAIYQAGYPVQNVEALNLLPSPPIPVLRFPTLPPQVQMAESSIQGPNITTQLVTPAPLINSVVSVAQPPVAQQPSLPSQSQASAVAPPVTQTSEQIQSSVPLTKQGAGVPKPNLVYSFPIPTPASTSSGHKTFHGGNLVTVLPENGYVPPASSHIEDDFADFQSSTPTQLNQSVSDEFDDFKQADLSSTLTDLTQNMQSKTFASPISVPHPTVIEEKPFNQNRNMGQVNGKIPPMTNLFHNDPITEDKYAVFKNLDLVPPTEIKPVFSEYNVPETVIESRHYSDDFGDFLCADNSTPIQSNNATRSNSPLELFQTTSHSSNGSQNVQDDSIADYGNFQSNQLNLGVGTFSDKGSVKSLESPVYLYESDNLDALSISSFHHSPSRSRKLYTEDDISFDKISMGQPGDGSNEHSATFSTSSHGSSSTETGEQVEFDTLSVNALPITDRYSFIRNQVPVCLDKVATEWLKSLSKCKEMLDEAKSTFYFACNELAHEVLEELFETDEIEDYLENITEVYCVVRRIYASSLSSGHYTGNIQVALHDNDLIWDELSAGISSYYKLPEKIKFDFSSAILSPTNETQNKSCGVCLLDVDANCGVFGDESVKLTYGARQYHASCANFWVNCVDFLLPALQNAELL